MPKPLQRTRCLGLQMHLPAPPDSFLARSLEVQPAEALGCHVKFGPYHLRGFDL